MIMSLKQKKRKFKPRIKLNYNIYTPIGSKSCYGLGSVIILVRRWKRLKLQPVAKILETLYLTLA